MTRQGLRIRDGLSVLFVAALTFSYFVAASLVLGRMGAETSPLTAASLLVRFILAVFVATVMLASERRRPNPTLDAALGEGIVVAVVVIVTNNLFGITEVGWRLAARTGLMLVGLPLLTSLTHLLDRRKRQAS
jgi:hypothetical protein